MMKKTNKANNRREKLKERKRNAEANRLILSEKLSSALVTLCAPDLPEYTDDSKGVDIVGRKILYQFGQIAWNVALIGETAAEHFMNFNKLAEKERAMVREEIGRLIRQKNTQYPNLRVQIEDITIQLKAGQVVVKAKPGEYIPVPKAKPLPPQAPLTPDSILALRKKLSLTQVVFAQKLGVSARVISAWEHGKSHPNGQQESVIRQMTAAELT